MNLQWFTSPEWANVVKALLHTLWQGAVIAVLLGLALRRMDSPVARYRSSLAALAGVLIAGIVTWAVLNRPVSVPTSNAPAPAVAAVVEPSVQTDAASLVVHFPPSQPKAVAGLGWTAWLALVWLAGATVMIGRAGFQVAGAERLRRASQPLADVRIAELLAEARKAVGLARRVRLAVTDRLTSPAVVGVLVPTLILPLSLTSTLSPEQIRFILLHELAHIRRGDYFANLFQLFAEALLFYHPAVWWMSHQMRIEREACCDALAIQLSGAPADYARTLVHVAENVLNPSPQAAPAFGDKREPSSLADRVQRLLVPGYRPRLRLTWRAMLGALCVGGTLLTLSAIGTRVTVAAILSPQQRIARIEKKMTELGEKPDTGEFGGDWNKMPKVLINGAIRTADGSPVPKWVQVNINTTLDRSSYGTSGMARNGLFTNSIPAGSIMLSAEVTNYAPVVAGPLDGWHTNLFFYVVMTLERGFDVPLQIQDADSGKLLPDAAVSTMFWIKNNGFQTHYWKSGADGALTLTHCTDLPMDVTVNVPGYEIFKKRLDHLSAGVPVTIALRPGKTVSGTVLDKASGQPLAGAEFHLIYQAGGEGAGNYAWDNSLFMLGQSDVNGAFRLNQLRDGVRYYLGVSAPGHESVILKNVTGDTNNLVIRLGPELIVHGHVNGNLELLPQSGHDRMLDLNITEVYGNNSYGNSTLVPVHVANGKGTFLFTNRTAGIVTLSGLNCYTEDREVTAPIDDWVVNLTGPPSLPVREVPKREVVFRFKHPSGVPPRGTVQVEIPDNLDINHLTSHYQAMEFTNGEVHAQIAIGGRTSVEPQHMIGYWFNRAGLNGNLLSIVVTKGVGPMLIDIPLIPAGAVYAKVRNADGTPAGGVLFGVTELKRAPGRDQNSLDGSGGDGFADNAPRQWVSGPLPLGGKYQIHAWRGNSFCVSEPVKLTESDPDAEVELQFTPGKKFMGQVLGPDGKPLRDVELKPLFTLATDHSFGLTALYSNERGWFELSDATPDLGGYSVEVDAPGIMTERVALNFKAQPQTIRLKRGHTLAGRVVEAGTGQPIPGAEVRALDYDHIQRPMVTTQTDADGRFEFNTLDDAQYSLYTADGEIKSDFKFRADGNTNVELRIKLYGWSKVKPKVASAATENIKGIIADPKFRTALHALEQRSDYDSGKEPAAAEGTTRATSIQENRVETATESTGEARSSDGVEADTNKAQIFIQAHLYQTAAGELEKTGTDWKFTEAGNGHEAYLAVPAGEFKAVLERLTARRPRQISSPRLVTLDGQPGEISLRNDQNIESFFIRPTVDGGVMKVAVEGAVITARSGEENTNAFDFQVPVETGGALLLRMDNFGGSAASNLVALVYFQILTNGVSNFQQRLQRIIKPADGTNPPAQGAGGMKVVTLEPDGSVREDRARQAAIDAGANLMMSFKVDSSLPENQLNQALLDAGVKMPLTVTMYNSEGGVLLVQGTAEQLVLATRAVYKLNGASAGQIEAVNRDYIKAASVQPMTDVRTNMLFTRTFKVDVQRFIAGLKNMGVEIHETTNSAREISAAARDCFRRLGVDLESPPGKAIFFNDRSGMLFVKASEPDLDVVDKVIQTINQMAPQVHIKARFLQVPNGTITGFGDLFNATNAIAGQFTGILNETNTKALLRSLKSQPGFEILAEPEITTTSGRQCQMRVTQVVTVLTNFVFQENTTTNVNGPSAIIPQTMQFEAGPMLDVVPVVLADGCTINLIVTPTVNEFLGYASPPDVPNVTGTNNRVQLPFVLPHFSKRQMTARLDLWDGQTVVLGGMPEITYSTHKTPVLGSVPLMGRLFRSESSKTNEIVVLVTAEIVDPAGNRVHTEEEASHFHRGGDSAHLQFNAAPDSMIKQWSTDESSEPVGNRVQTADEAAHFQIKAAPDTFPTGGGRAGGFGQ